MNLTGTVPSEISTLTSLQSISAPHNPSLHGALPTELGHLPLLQTIHFRSCNLSGPIPDTLSMLRKLEKLDLYNNQFTGTIPSGLTQNTRLEILMLSYNLLTGTVPQFGRSTRDGDGSTVENNPMSLHRLGIISNILEGTLPTSIYDLTSLAYLTAQQALPGGSMGTEISHWNQLETLFLIDITDLKGTIPTEIGVLQDLIDVRFNNCSLTGTIPTELGRLDRIRRLELRNNHLVGTVPSELFSLNRLNWIELQANQLTGTVPTELVWSTYPPGTCLFEPLAFREVALDLRNTLHFATLAEHLGLHNNSLSYNSLALYCNQSNMLTQVSADCRAMVGNDEDSLPQDAEVTCPCCTTCCDDTSGNCERNLQQICMTTSERWTNEHGPKYDETRGTECDCKDDGHTMSCNDTSCQTCNRDGSVCVVNTEYGLLLNDDGRGTRWTTTFQYVIGRNDTVYFETSGHECYVEINGRPCRECVGRMCADSFGAYHPSCDNLEGVGNLDLCNLDDRWETSPLAVFAFQEPLVRHGCPLKLGPMVD